MLTLRLLQRSSIKRKSQANNLKDNSEASRLKVINNTFDNQQKLVYTFNTMKCFKIFLNMLSCNLKQVKKSFQ